MVITKDLFEFLARAAQGDESECPPAIDADWHAALAYPQAYVKYCLENFGVVIEHITNRPGLCKAKVPCRAGVRR
jgi:hypothetical protein